MIERQENVADYTAQFERYRGLVKSFVCANTYPHSLESSFEALNDWSLFNTLEEVKDWFIKKRNSADMEVVNIPLNETKGWCVDAVTGNISHESKDFFTVHGIRVTTSVRETESGWDQPILEQVGYDGGLLGLIRKRFKGIPHYLCEAKAEPGNYGKVQFSPSLQATYSNLKKVHLGRKPYFSKYFETPENYENFTILFSAWLAEDGGRFQLKRNKGILLEVPENFTIELPNDNFIWLSLHQIKSLLIEDSWISPHIRGILAHV